MKKIVALSLVIVVFSTALSAQSPADRFRHHRIHQRLTTRELTRPEIIEMKRDQFRYRLTERRVRRDGIVTPFERRKLQKMKRHNRVQQFRFRHNAHRRLI